MLPRVGRRRAGKWIVAGLGSCLQDTSEKRNIWANEPWASLELESAFLTVYLRLIEKVHVYFSIHLNKYQGHK